jgi:hypothetical protein
MSFLKRLTLICVSLAFITTGTLANAAEIYSKYQWPPMWNGDQYTGQEPLTHYGFDIVDTFNSGSTDYSFIRVMTPGPQPFCTSLNDPSCAEDAKKYGWWIIRLLPPCASVDQETECIEGLSVAEKSGKVTKYVNSYVYKRLTFPADSKNKLGEGSGTSTWVDPASPDSGNGFAITVSGDAGAQYGASSFPLNNFAATVIPYKTLLGNYDAPDSQIVNRRAQFFTKPGTSSPINCIWLDKGKCGQPTDYPDLTAITLTLHLPTNMASWVLGRLGNPEITVASISNNSGNGYERITVSASPVTVPMVGGKVSITDAPKAVTDLWKNNNCPECEHGIWAVNAPSSGENAFVIMNAFKPFMNDRSMVSIPSWSISSLKENSPSLSKCVKPGSISGLVTTNATVYQGAPPAFDGTSLNYKVGAMHFTDDGQVFKGTYDLLMPASTAQCLYGYSSTPISATVSITNESGVADIATTVLTERNGWLHLAANGFTFSNPTIQVKFAKPAPIAAPVASPNPSTGSTSQLAQPKKVIWCAKGNAKKKITALNPACPKGYKKIAAPLAR